MVYAHHVKIENSGMHIKELCRLREISPYGIWNPLMIPSFSSRGFDNLKEIFTILTSYISEVCLVSAYDIDHCFLNLSDIYVADLLFVDSGGYETKQSEEIYEDDNGYNVPKSWSSQRHLNVLQALEPLSEIVVISYDEKENGPTQDQVKCAKELFEQFPDYASDFLLKPELKQKFIIPELIKPYLQTLSEFSILGVTEKELGPNLWKRCHNLIEIRSILTACGNEIPIHVFGCLDPPTCILYLMCGANIFDGLPWLKFAFRNGIGTYMAQICILDHRINIPDEEITIMYQVKNLKMLIDLQVSMGHFAKTLDVEAFQNYEEWLPKIKNILNQVGLESEGVL